MRCFWCIAIRARSASLSLDGAAGFRFRWLGCVARFQFHSLGAVAPPPLLAILRVLVLVVLLLDFVELSTASCTWLELHGRVRVAWWVLFAQEDVLKGLLEAQLDVVVVQEEEEDALLESQLWA